MAVIRYRHQRFSIYRRTLWAARLWGAERGSDRGCPCRTFTQYFCEPDVFGRGCDRSSAGDIVGSTNRWTSGVPAGCVIWFEQRAGGSDGRLGLPGTLPPGYLRNHQHYLASVLARTDSGRNSPGPRTGSGPRGSHRGCYDSCCREPCMVEEGLQRRAAPPVRLEFPPTIAGGSPRWQCAWLGHLADYGVGLDGSYFYSTAAWR